MSDKGTLFVVTTPIGNLGDMTPRAIEVLKSAKGILAEDTRRTRELLTHFAIPAQGRLESFHAHSGEKAVERALERLERGDDLALVSDAGTPVVSDPGEDLTRAAIARGVRVSPVPGASAVLAALVGSGLAGGGFRFFGFLPRDGSARREALARVADTPEPVILFESPERTNDTLADLTDATPTRWAAVARELTKVHEEFVRGPLAEIVMARDSWRGEVVIVLGAHAADARAETIDDAALDARIETELAAGGHAKSIAERLAAWSGRPKRHVYERVLAKKPRR